ncbi:MAG: hypothetical protein P8P46_12235 [Alphaproteobacteria bacterium]|nr:hypothetical protein [Alphaproteobacteria bacterium]|tara:strand:- start:217 stop:1002 length:786 start_codon:yes stop_codon:yes gene_type:complete
MLLEAMTYAITPCPYQARRMGFLRENISIISRHRRCKKVWSHHLSKSREVIKTAITKTTGDNRVIVFGAGLGYDLPLEELTAHFKEVLLVDLVHSLPIRWMAWRNPTTKLITHDITESLDNLFAGNLNIRSPSRFLADYQTDLIISSNILSQLPTLPAAYLEDDLKVSQDDIQAISKAIIQCHLDYLRKFSGTVCLITDIEREIWDANGKLIKKFSAINDMPFPWPNKTWIWEIAPLGEESNDYSVKHKVAGISNITDSIL